jgi:hypothetical protein
VLSHGPRQVASWLIFDVSQKNPRFPCPFNFAPYTAMPMATNSLPPESNDVAVLRNATAIKETWSADDATSMLEEGFTLIGVAP